MEVKVTGADQLHKVYKDIREVGDKELRLALTRAIREATAPTKALIKEQQLAVLPKRGGLNVAVARNRISNRVRMSMKDPGVQITITADYDVGAINRGKVRHPVFARKGKKRTWVTQEVTPGSITGAIDETKVMVQEQIQRELKKIEDYLQR
jgi:hypothetical protein